MNDSRSVTSASPDKPVIETKISNVRCTVNMYYQEFLCHFPPERCFILLVKMLVKDVVFDSQTSVAPPARWKAPDLAGWWPSLTTDPPRRALLMQT